VKIEGGTTFVRDSKSDILRGGIATSFYKQLAKTFNPG
jgi:hypothetical protein